MLPNASLHKMENVTGASTNIRPFESASMAVRTPGGPAKTSAEDVIATLWLDICSETAYRPATVAVTTNKDVMVDDTFKRYVSSSGCAT